MIVRKIKQTDFPAVIDIAIRSRQSIYSDLMPINLWRDKPYEEWEKNYLDILEGRSKIEKAFFCVLEEENVIKGFGVSGYVYPESRHNLPLHWVHELFLDPDETGKKYGSTLMREMAQDMKKDGAKEFGLCVGQTNAKAKNFYEKLDGKILRPFEDNIVHEFKVPAFIYHWDNLDRLIEQTKNV